MKTLLILIAQLFICVIGTAQNIEADSLRRLLKTSIAGAERVQVLEGLSFAYLSTNPDTAMYYAMEGLKLARDIKDRLREAVCINALGNVYFQIGDNAKALEMYLEYLEIKESLPERKNIAVAYFNIAGVYTEEKDYQHALQYAKKAKQEDERAGDEEGILYDLYTLCAIYLRMNQTDSALFFIEKSYELATRRDDRNMLGAILNSYGELYAQARNYGLASKYYRSSIPFVVAINDNAVLTSNYFGLAKILKTNNRVDSAAYYARKGLLIAQAAPFPKQVLEISSFLTTLFSERHEFDSAFRYQTLAEATEDSLFSVEQARKVYNLKFQEQERQQAMETAKMEFENKIRVVVGVGVALFFLVIAIVLWRNNRQKQKVNVLLQQQKEKVESTLAELKMTQAQLIHAEKMASLGEVTAGIAHEIQNPLNFIMNFSEVTNELIDEVKTAPVTVVHTGANSAIIDSIKENLDKISHHGKRADAIVKGMLQHSRSSNSRKEFADINKLTDEHVQLAYHGQRTKIESLDIRIETKYDEGVGSLEVIPQDLGRVIINLMNNAIYAVKAKKNAKRSEAFEASIFVSTEKTNDAVLISVKDNGNGIPAKNVDKIFQPFFTTKPTGEGTGLGLSLSYHIVTKGHSGKILVETKADEGSTFTINLPLS